MSKNIFNNASSIDSNDISGIIPTSKGGTGVNNLSSGGILVGNGTGPVTTRAGPIGAIVGTSDAQLLTSKVISAGTNTILVPVGMSEVNLTSVFNQPVTTSASPEFVGVNTDSIIERTLNAGVLIDFPRVSNVPNDETNTHVLTKDTATGRIEYRTGPAGALVGTSDTQVLSNKSFSTLTTFNSGLTSTGAVNINAPLNIIDNPGNVLYTNKILPYSSNTIDMTPSTIKAAIVSTTSLNNGTIGDVIVVPGTSGAVKTLATTADLTNLLTTNTAQTITAVKTFATAPNISTINNGAIVLTLPGIANDTLVGATINQTLTNKTINAADGNIVDANRLNGVTMTGAAATVGQLLRFNGTVWTPYLFAYGSIFNSAQNATATTIVATNTFVQVAGTWGLQSGSVNFTSPSNGQLVCGRTGRFLVSYNLSYLGNNNMALTAAVYRNGAQVVQSTAFSHIHSSAGAIGTSNNIILDLTSGDVLTMRIANQTNTNAVTVSWFNLMAVQLE